MAHGNSEELTQPRADVGREIAMADSALHTLEGGDLQPIGPYRRLKLLGKGGMGAVYLAERDQAGVQQRVAIKLMGRVLDDEAVRRFRQERQILARLAHPNIARLYDGGYSDDGRPYLAMEYIEGLTLTEHCDAKALSIPQRIALFLKVCAALSHAHQNLIIHRDIKPSNVMVSRDGEPKLLDFGIAKPLTHLAMGEGPMETRADLLLLTPNYASPEQIQGEAATTAADVYAAGVLLYELLTGHSPYAKLGESRPRGSEIELLNRVTHGYLRPPSEMLARQLRGVASGIAQPGDSEAQGVRLRDLARHRGEPSANRLAKRLRGDLDNILAKAMAREPQGRYPSIEALAQDLQRHLRGEPVSARPASFGYRAAKFLRRNRWPVAATAAVILFSLTLAATTVWQNRLIRAERDRATAAEQRARTQQQIAEQAFRALQRESYVGAIDAADDAFAIGQIELAQSLLERTPPELRGWEWGWLVEPPVEPGEKRQPLQVVAGEGAVTFVQADPAERGVWSAASGGTLTLWGWSGGAGFERQRVIALPAGHRPVTLQGARLLGVDAGGGAWELDLNVGEIDSLPLPGEVTALAQSERLLVAGLADGRLAIAARSLGDHRSGSSWRLIDSGGAEPVTALAVGATRIVVGFSDGRVEQRDLSGEQVRSWQAHDNAITLLALSADADQLISASADLTAHIWALASGEQLSSLVGHEAVISSASFTADGQRIFTGDRNGEVKLSESHSGKELLGLDEEHGLGPHLTIALASDGRSLFVGDAEGRLSGFIAHDWRASAESLNSFLAHTTEEDEEEIERDEGD